MSEQQREYMFSCDCCDNKCKVTSYNAIPPDCGCLINSDVGALWMSRPHPVPAQGTSKLCFGTQHPASECCQQCNELETCKQKQRYLDYDKNAAARKAREDVLNEVREKLSHIRYQDEDMWFIEATINAIESLRAQQAGEP